MEICILAGGLSSRMGRNKSQLRLGGKTLLGHIRRTAKALDLPVRVIRRDLVPRCGPLGGIYTALKTTRADVVLFLACDMPLVSEPLLKKFLKRTARTNAIFIWSNGAAGFPFLLNKNTLPLVQKLMQEKHFSLQTLARETGAKHFRVSRAFADDLLNLNTPADWSKLQKTFREKELNFGKGSLSIDDATV